MFFVDADMDLALFCEGDASVVKGCIVQVNSVDIFLIVQVG